MRRTYRSKKDTGGGLDHRDVLLTVDEKSSAFDAFYIENLKQTKRDLSCMATSSQYNAVPHKARKKKFVKRIVKDVEKTPRESMSRSTYLTPDKSIRVNRGEDLFDKLLNTSSTVLVEPNIKKDDLFLKIQSGRPSKTYASKRNRKVKKYNYSSSESNETDKENESNNSTDIRAYKLIVEKEVPNSSKNQDESINNIVQNLSLLNNMKNSSSSSPIISFNYGKKRTKQLQSTVIDKSILSSTPLKDIRTATSIYKFSPISRMTYGETTNYITITEENDNNSAVNDPKSPVTHLKQTGGIKGKCSQIFASTSNEDKGNLSNVSAIEKSNSNDDIKNPGPHIENITETVTSEEPQGVNDLEHISVLSNSINESDLKVSLGGSKPSQLFFGFTSSENNLSNGDKEIDNEVMRLKEKYLQDISNKYDLSESFNNSELVLGGSKPSEPFHGFDIDSQINASVVNSNKILEKVDFTYKSNSDQSLDSQGAVSLYDTCNSDKFSEISNEICREPVINLTKMNDDVFREFYEKMAAYSSDLTGDEDMDGDSESSNRQDKELVQYESFSSHENDIVEKIEVDSDDYSNPDQVSICESDNSNAETVSPLKSESDSSCIFENIESNSCEDEEVRCFINTRRRVNFKCNSIKLSLDNSSSSGSCNRTILSNYKLTKNSPKINKLSQNEILVSDEDACIIRNSPENDNTVCNLDIDSNHSESDEVELKTDPRESFITTRKSSRKFSALQNSSESSVESKPAIVLQPGKKWERSLSIYRRMTMMNDHFERSLLEEESMDRKGRKYRQSVISTMEMQEGSLHNESISSRRSTFVVKPCRSTIRILKDSNSSRISLCNNTVYDDLKDFLSDDCDDTIVELSKLSIADSGHEITVVEKLHEDRLTTARDYVLRRCNQTEAFLFDECYPDTALKNCHKIGEGVYGEVFLWRARDGRARVMKIVPVAGTIKVNGENQKDFHEIISEIVIAMELSAIRTPIADLERQLDEGKDIDALDLHNIQNATDVFNEVLAVRCVYGSYTSRLLDLWELYDECKGSENDNPAILPSDQQYIVLELANAGQDLESYQFNNAEQAHALFWQVAYGLAVGEEAFQFEHRDLHWGNVLIAPTEQKWATFVVRGRGYRVARCGVAATVIDYSLSRVALPLAPPASAALFADLARDDSLFDAVGDYQFQVYRLMRDKLGNDWKNFEPYTNILWLHYTVDKMITALRYKRTNTKIHKHYISKLKAIKNRILSYGSAAQFVLTDIEY